MWLVGRSGEASMVLGVVDMWPGRVRALCNEHQTSGQRCEATKVVEKSRARTMQQRSCGSAVTPRHYFRPFPCVSFVACRRSHVQTVVPQAPTTDLGNIQDDDNIQRAKATENEGIITNRTLRVYSEKPQDQYGSRKRRRVGIDTDEANPESSRNYRVQRDASNRRTSLAVRHTRCSIVGRVRVYALTRMRDESGIVNVWLIEVVRRRRERA
jgi:hypothetical protein